MSLLQRLRYVLWYFRRPPWDSGLTPPELLEFLQDRPAGRAIDLGCGTGTNVITLSRLGWSVTGIDFVPGAIAKARRKVLQAGVNADLRVGDVTHLQGIDDPYEFALDLGCYHGLPEKEREAYLSELLRVLRPGGTWFMYGFLSPSGDSSGLGLSPEAISLILKYFHLAARLDGYDNGRQPSAYFIFEKPDAA